MAAAFPYTHYACSCSNEGCAPPISNAGREGLDSGHPNDGDARPFDTHGLRANYSLYPLDQLLYCDECDALRCPRCWTEEVLKWYCPQCLFEAPSSTIKSDGNRCSRSCYHCPACTSVLSVTSVPPSSQTQNALLKPNTVPEEAYMLQCQFCDWTSYDVGIRFHKPSKITEQLAKQRKTRHGPKDEDPPSKDSQSAMDRDNAFANLKSFYSDQLSDSADVSNLYVTSAYNSPANLTRIMSLYGGLSAEALKKSREKPQPMREARDQSEGLSTYLAPTTDTKSPVSRQLQSADWSDIVTAEQRSSSPLNMDARFANELWPVATALRTRRGKRCKECRQYLARPEAKASSLRYKIRLVALNHIPRLTMKSLHHANPGQAVQSSFRLRLTDPVQPALQPLVMQQYVLTVRNPIFETVKVTLATPGITPGKVQSRVTILCPTFTVGPAGDVWEEALSSGAVATSAPDGGRQAAMASLMGKSAEEAERQPEAGKVWDRTRNSTSIIVEIVPGLVEVSAVAEDDNVLEIPIHMRAEWEATFEDESVEKIAKGMQPGDKIQKELAYWCVLGVGRIARGG